MLVFTYFNTQGCYPYSVKVGGALISSILCAMIVAAYVELARRSKIMADPSSGVKFWTACRELEDVGQSSRVYHASLSAPPFPQILVDLTSIKRPNPREN
jgi:hypothetical protein